MKHLIHFMTFLLVLTSSPQAQCGICDGYNTWIYVPYSSTDPQPQTRTFEKHTILHFNTLTEALSSPNLNNTCLVIINDVKLASIAFIQNVERLLIRSQSDDKYTVKCTENNNTGIYFNTSKNILIKNIRFENCGGVGGGGGGGVGHRNLSAAISFNTSADVHVRNVIIKSSIGYGIILFNTNNVRIDNDTYISHSNNFDDMYSRSFTQGGGLYIEFSSCRNTSIKLESVTFFKNNSPSGKGGAISLVYRRAKGNNFSCTDCIFDSNIAEQGGAVYVLFSKGTWNNKISFDGNKGNFMMNNRATKNGGAIQIVHEHANTKNWVSLRSMHFNSNKAYLGGCLSTILDNFFSIYMIKNTIKSKFFCTNCKFINCQAMIGSAMYLQGMRAYFEDLSVINSQTRDEDDKKGYGGVYALKSALNFNGATKFQKNNSTGLVLESSTLKMSDTVLFKRNNGYNGGAISLYGHSQIILSKNACVEFTRNYAKNKGGAIYLTKFDKASLPWITNHTKDYRIFKCFINFEEEGNRFGTVTFHHNNVRRTGFGSDIYITTLRNCRRENEANLKQTFVTWRNFNFTNKKLNSIVTGAIKFDKLEKWNHIYPGKLITPQIRLEDERGNFVQGEASFNFSNNVRIEQDIALLVGKSLTVQFRLLGNEDTNFNATIHTISGRYISKTLPPLHLKKCPFGMKLNGRNKCKCDHANNRANGIAECNEGEIYMYRNQWVPINSKNSSLKQVGYGCPLGYCKPCNTTNSINMFCNYDKNTPCAKGRNQRSRLCSKCERHKSATFGGLNNCRDCRGTRGYIWVSLIVIAVVSLFVIVLVVLRLDIMSYHLGICIYFYQVLYYHYTPEMWGSSNDKFHTFLSILIGSIEFSYTSDGYPVFCVFDGMNDLEKTAYNNIIPVWMLLFWFVLYRLSPYHERYRFSKSKLLHAFTIIGMMVYTDLTKNCINLLDFLIIGPHTYPYAYAAALYGRAVHLPYFISALVVCIFITAYIPVHFFVFAVKQMKYKIVREPDHTSVESKLLYFVRKKRYWFLPYFFLSRTFTFMTNMLIVNNPSQKTTVTLVSLLNFVVFTLAWPYRDAKENWVESVLLACLTVIGVLNLGLTAMYQEDKAQTIKTVVKIISSAPLCVVLCTVFMAVAGKRCIKKRQEQRINVPVQVPHRLDFSDESM